MVDGTERLAARNPPATRLRLRFHRPRKSRVFFAALAVAVLGLAAAVDGFAHPTTLNRRSTAYTTSGQFSYTAQTTHPDPVVYPTGVAETGQPLVIGDVNQVSVAFSFEFRSALRHDVSGTIGLQVVFVGDSGWRNAYTIESPAAFSGDDASTTATLSLSTLGQLLAKLQAGSKRAARAYTVYLQPAVRYAGTVGGHRVQGLYNPALAFTLDAAVFAPRALSEGNPSAQARELAAELHPQTSNDLPRAAENVISFLGLRAPALAFRILGLLLIAFGIVGAIRSQRRRRDDIWSNEKRVAFRAGRSLIDVRGLEHTLPPGTITTEVLSFDHLVSLAVQTDRPILHQLGSKSEFFAVDLPPRLYVYRKRLGPPAAATSAPAPGHRRATV